MSPTVVVVGPQPPPIHGASRVSRAVVARLEKEPSIRLHVVDTAGGPAGARGVAYHLARVASHVRAVGRILRARAGGGVIVYVAGAGGLGLWYQAGVVAASRFAGCRVVFHHHSYRYLSGGAVASMALLSRLLRARDSQMFLSPGMEAEYVARYTSRARSVICSNAFMIDVVRCDRVARGTYGLVHISNLSPAKGSIDVIAIFEELRLRDVDVDLTLVGPATPTTLEAIRSATERHPGRLRYLGPRGPGEIGSILAGSDLFVFPTCYVNEAEPLVVLEAMGYGLPVVATPRGAMAEIVPAEWLAGTVHAATERIVELMGRSERELSDRAIAAVTELQRKQVEPVSVILDRDDLPR